MHSLLVCFNQWMSCWVKKVENSRLGGFHVRDIPATVYRSSIISTNSMTLQDYNIIFQNVFSQAYHYIYRLWYKIVSSYMMNYNTLILVYFDQTPYGLITSIQKPIYLEILVPDNISLLYCKEIFFNGILWKNSDRIITMTRIFCQRFSFPFEGQ